MINHDDPKDITNFLRYPLVAVPAQGESHLLTDYGQRMLVANDGLWFERKTPLMHIRTRIAEQQALELPFGSLSHYLQFVFEEFPSNEVDAFEASLRGRTNADCTKSWILWSKTGGFELYDLGFAQSNELDSAYEAVVDGRGKYLVMELCFGDHISSSSAATLNRRSAGGYFVAKYRWGPDAKVIKDMHLIVEKMRFSTEAVVTQLAMQESM